MRTPHTITLMPNPNAAFSDFQMEAVCSCQWQALAFDEEQARNFARMHLHRHGQPLTQIKESNGGQVSGS